MPKKPVFRKLRGYAFDPSMSLELDTVGINEITYKIPWEDNLNVGPEGEYIKVVDRDPSSNAVYTPVNLRDEKIVASDGLDPSESNPQFHQQMVYAVAMNTIQNFEKAIGRKIQWSPVLREFGKGKEKVIAGQYVEKLVLYPHAFRGANAYYSPDRKAILFGFFNATPASADLHMPGSIVYSCLSHDIIAHELTHAILDGMFTRFMETTHPDVAAFHEAFADIVALFQHFSFVEVTNHEIAKTGGRVDAETLLGKLAVEFGKASGGHDSLRDGIGHIHENGEWQRIKPNLLSYRTVFECHDRGAILVAAVFDAFISMYNQRASEMIKIATGGTGKLPEGELNTHLARALASEASKTASHILNMCIRALDYCPPVDITFGDYLRAIITSDVELVADDKYNYRISFIDAFRKRGIYPEGISSLSVESLTYNAGDHTEAFKQFTEPLLAFLTEFKNEIGYIKDRKHIFNMTRQFIGFRNLARYFGGNTSIVGLHYYFYEKVIKDPQLSLFFENHTGLVFSDNYNKMDMETSPKYKQGPTLEIQDIRLNNRVGPDGDIQNQVIIILAQSCKVRVTYNEENDDYTIKTFKAPKDYEFDEGEFTFRGGCTLVFDLNEMTLKHVISKPILDMNQLSKPNRIYAPNKARAIMQYECEYGRYSEVTGIAALKEQIEPLAFMHQHKKLNDE